MSSSSSYRYNSSDLVYQNASLPTIEFKWRLYHGMRVFVPCSFAILLRWIEDLNDYKCYGTNLPSWIDEYSWKNNQCSRFTYPFTCKFFKAIKDRDALREFVKCQIACIATFDCLHHWYRIYYPQAVLNCPVRRFCDGKEFAIMSYYDHNWLPSDPDVEEMVEITQAIRDSAKEALYIPNSPRWDEEEVKIPESDTEEEEEVKTPEPVRVRSCPSAPAKEPSVSRRLFNDAPAQVKPKKRKQPYELSSYENKYLLEQCPTLNLNASGVTTRSAFRKDRKQ